jgi:hypothetical protein
VLWVKHFTPRIKINSKKLLELRELHKLDDLDPDKQGYLNASNSELDSLRTMNVYTSSDNININTVPQFKIGSSKLIFSKKLHPDCNFDKYKCRLVFRGYRWVDFYKKKHILEPSDQKSFVCYLVSLQKLITNFKVLMFEPHFYRDIYTGYLYVPPYWSYR